jgi:hypothetical protein
MLFSVLFSFLLKFNSKVYVHWNYFVFHTAVFLRAFNCAINGRHDMQRKVCMRKTTSVSPVAESCKMQANLRSLLPNSYFELLSWLFKKVTDFAKAKNDRVADVLNYSRGSSMSF